MLEKSAKASQNFTLILKEQSTTLSTKGKDQLKELCKYLK
jgi:hypothetical protein